MLPNIRVAAFIVLLLPILGCAGAGQPKPAWETAPGVDLGALTTFDLAEAADDRPLTVLDSQVRRALSEALIAKGYEQSSTEPDFVVSYQPVAYEIESRSNPVTIGVGLGTWGRNVGGSVGTSVGVGGRGDERVNHRLTIRALDPENRSELWIGTTTTLEHTAEAGAVDRAVAGVMRGFPARQR